MTKRPLTNVDHIVAIEGNSRDYIHAVYLDWVNNFITVEQFASMYRLDINEATVLINMARKIHEERTG